MSLLNFGVVAQSPSHLLWLCTSIPKTCNEPEQSKLESDVCHALCVIRGGEKVVNCTGITWGEFFLYWASHLLSLVITRGDGEAWVLIKQHRIIKDDEKFGMKVYACNLSTREAEAEGSQG